MPSPFPGMDPYLEASHSWGDFHNNLAAQIQAQLNEVIRPRYYATSIPNVTYQTLEVGRLARTVPDVSVFQNLPSLKEGAAEYTTSMAAGSTTTGATTTIAQPPIPVESEVTLEEPLTLYSVEIYTAEDGELVTVIEILSPVNKRNGDDAHGKYLRKRQDILNTASIHLVEVDLLRGGNRPPLLKPVPEAPYYILLSRAEVRPRVTVWPIQFKDKLPTISVPLNYPDPDAKLDMAHAVAEVYDRCAYDLRLNYTETPPPPKLLKEQQDFVDQLLQPFRT